MPVCAPPPFAPAHACAADARWRAHDLLRLDALPHADGEPDWVRDAWTRAPFAVVRRAAAAAGFVAVGVRGTSRAERYGTWARSDDVAEAVAPEDLAHRLPAGSRASLPAFALLDALREDIRSLQGLHWGPTGSAGFELAAGVPAVTPASDLDLLIRTPDQLPRIAAAGLLDALEARARRAGIRIDVQLDTPAGGVALAEWAAGRARVLARGPHGARLVDDPWTAAPAAC
jgi:phosphoribosyl-dephospho-CoA transferase